MPPPKLARSQQEPVPGAASRATRTRIRPAAVAIEEKAVAAPATVVSPAPTPATTPEPVSAPRATRPRGTAQRAKQARRASALLKFVSDPTRLQVILFLVDGERHVGALCEQLGQSQPAVSHHLALLRHGRLIEPRRSGKHNFYGLTEAGRELAQVVNSIVG